MDRLTKKQLIARAKELNAKVLANDLKSYENAVYQLVANYYINGSRGDLEIVAYSAGFYENTGCINKIINLDTNKYYYVCWY